MSGAAYSKHLSALQSSNSQFFCSFSCGDLWHRFGVPTYERLDTGMEQCGWSSFGIYDIGRADGIWL
ncbi:MULTISPECIES: hypothetical protein [unclassified Mesorhizobium]|uniref:hypothetical protein n=1 Tax=unclassified Mesorhizobium TaxID=325217 RepID=UPI0007FEF4A9|nr:MULTISPECIES: hypothetical protein [unclassified Mesorhizobium]MDG4851859.1 hypothetical protein [Mesorhizobium sp. WSM4982]MDG4906396.1 hypothetical protein [Mesorhizobium sp. WSM4898]MDG4911429.1 hypothetical protein [Mesorhizobium sp. WSM4983]OBQ80249.1 hypothetical protein A9K71_05365 [Mesorhizobium sp. WSM3873]OBQ89757.1 hypothetical protein A9K66_17470 [Mesorhizobium sp. AA23]